MNDQKENKSDISRRRSARLGQNTRDMVLIALFTALTAVCAQITVPAAVPFTLQTLAVFLAGSILGLKKGTASVLIYILLGAVGIPVFSNFTCGAAAILGPTGGYIIGFIAITVITGFFKSRFPGKLWLTALGMAIGLIVCYFIGTVWFIVVYNSTKGGMSVLNALSLCVFPFLPFDAAKIGVAALLSVRLNRLIKL